MVPRCFDEQTNFGFVVLLVLFDELFDIQAVVLHPESNLLLDNGSVLVFRRAVLGLHRSQALFA